MKKTPCLLLVLVCFLFRYTGAAQTFTSGDITVVQTTVMQHDSTLCESNCAMTAHVTIQNSFVGDSLKVFIYSYNLTTLIGSYHNTSGQNPWQVAVPVAMSQGTVLDNYLTGSIAHFIPSVLKVISGPDTLLTYNYNPNLPIYNLTVTNPCQYDTVSGRVYFDNNSDCIYNAGDAPLTQLQVSGFVTVNSPSFSGRTTGINTDTAGLYKLAVLKSWMVNYSLLLPPIYQFVFPYSACAPGSYLLATLPQANVNFPLQCTNNIDVQVGGDACGAVRPSIPFYLRPYVSNTGCNPASGQLKLIKDYRTTYNAALSTNPANSVNGDTLTWNYANLSNLTTVAYWNSFFAAVHLTPFSTVTIGDTLCFRVMTDTAVNDINPANNTYSSCLPVVNSFDPNEKEVSPAGVGPAGNIPASTSELIYTVRFQNTGTAPAINVMIIDSLDGHLVPGSFRILGASHPMIPVWSTPATLQFNFSNILLPDSNTNEPASHGFIRFSVKLQSALPLGTQIRNKALIFFDNNPAIVTNTVLNTIPSPLGMEEVMGASDEFQIYPNPATDKLYIRAKDAPTAGGKMMILDMNGRMLMEQALAAGTTEWDISRLAPRLYLLRVVSAQGTSVRKFGKL